MITARLITYKYYTIRVNNGQKLYTIQLITNAKCRHVIKGYRVHSESNITMKTHRVYNKLTVIIPQHKTDVRSRQKI